MNRNALLEPRLLLIVRLMTLVLAIATATAAPAAPPTVLESAEEARDLLRARPGALSSLQKISPDSAQVLASWHGQFLTLKGLTSLDAPTAHALATWQGHQLFLYDLRSLDVATAQALATSRARVLHVELRPVDADVCDALRALSGLLVSQSCKR